MNKTLITILTAAGMLLTLHGRGVASPQSYDHVLVDTVTIVDEYSTPSPNAGMTVSYRLGNGADLKFRVNDYNYTVTLIGGNAHGASTLEIPDLITDSGYTYQVTDIAYNALAANGSASPLTGVKTLAIPECVTWPGSGCFQGAPHLETVVIPPTLSVITPDMFANCPKLTTILIDNDLEYALTSICARAFSGCKSLESFPVTSQLSTIEPLAFEGCESLVSFNEIGYNSNFNVDDGILFENVYDNLAIYPPGRPAAEFTVPFGVKRVGDHAFAGNRHLAKVTLPASVSVIGFEAFDDCPALSEVVTGCTDLFIADRAFADCPALRSVTLYGHPTFVKQPGGGSLASFPATTRVTVEPGLPAVSLPDSDGGVLAAVYDAVAAMPYVRTMEIVNEELGFPAALGRGYMAGYGNAGPKPEVLRILEAIPDSMLRLETVDGQSRVKRIYVDDTTDTLRTLFFIGGIGGNDLIIGLFTGGDATAIHNFINDARANLH